MFRYLGFAWDPSSTQHTEAADLLGRRTGALSSSWTEVLTRKGLRVFCVDGRPGSLEPHLLAGEAGIVLGALFERNGGIEDDTPSRKASLSVAQGASILESHGRWLITHCWGNYVALLPDQATGRTQVIKDPTGSLPCFTTTSHGVTLVFSSITDCLALGLTFTINRSYLGARMLSGGGDIGQNALSEVGQVHRGECVEIDPKADSPIVVRQFYWNPLSFAETDDVIEDSELAVRAIRATVRSSTHTWASCHDSLMVRLSGGLDSSIIMGCLKDAPTQPRMVCYTYYNPRGRSDERPWARLAAQHATVERLEYAVSPADINLRSMLGMEASVEPVAAMGYLQRATIERQLAADRGATAAFTGDGGDSVFCSDSIAYAVSEYFHRHGLTPEAFRLASRVALYTDQSTWTILLRSFRRRIFGAKMTDQRQARLMSSKLVSPAIHDTLTVDERYPHVWFSHRNRVPWATIRRVGMLVCTPEFYHGVESSGSAPEVLSPLYSQPALELFLRIPVYEHFAGGRDRGLARQAFVQDVPQPILQRRWKDRVPGFYDELVYRNREILRELFLDGVLVGEGLLDKTAVEEALSSVPSKSVVLPEEIFKHLDLEIWARQWIRRM